MDSEGATKNGAVPARPARPAGGPIVEFPRPRSFGPLSWQAVRIASAVVLVLIALGALVQIFFPHGMR